jgi:hypothetical protein
MSDFSQIAAAVNTFCAQQGVDPKKAILIAGAAMHVHSLRPEVNDVDMLHPDLPGFVKGQVDGFEMDAGPGIRLPTEAMEFIVIGGLRVQTLPAMLVFYEHLSRPKDQSRIEALRELLRA